jgi:uncharacterized membrane-anchored protein
MNMKSARWIWVIVVLQIVFLAGWAGYHEVIRQTAPTVHLKTMPVDPRDILRGDYMTLAYEISRPDKSLVLPKPLGGEVFVVLRPKAGHHVIEEVLANPPAADDSRLWVRAHAWGAEDNPRLDYGIERFFVPEGRGTPNFTTLEVEASVSATHHLYIRRVWLDGKKFP